MADTAPASDLLRRVRSTPLRDLLRGRLSGRLDWRATIAAAPLPGSVRDVVETVVRHTRLWRTEKVEVADELLAHFADGITAGTTAEELVRCFGEPRAVARLIRRGKVRNRFWAWHLLRWARCGAAVLIAIYSVAAVYFFWGHPSPSVDYVGQFNQTIERVPVDQRAWPIYRSVLLSLRGSGWIEVVDHDPHGKHWPAMSAWLRVHQPQIAEVRRGASKPLLGFLLGPHGSGDDPLLFDAGTPLTDWYLLQPWTDEGDLRQLTLLLSDDAALACDEQDAPRVEQDVVAILNMADQTHGPSLLSDEVAIGFRSVAHAVLGRALVDAPGLLSDAQLQSLVERLSVPQVGFDLIDLCGEEKGFADLVQRTYTAGGIGGGHVAWSAMRSGVWWTMPGWEPQQPARSAVALQAMLAPLAIAAVASRDQMLAADAKLMDQANAELHRPLREVIGGQQRRWAEANSASLAKQVRYLPVLLLAPALHRVAPTAEIVLGQRDGLVVAVALERYRRQHGSYPRQLKQLVPAYLAEVPADRITGDPLRYRLVDGKPIVYSVGADRVDDGGTRPAKRLVHGDLIRGDVAAWGVDPKTAPRGDWVLFPPEPADPREDP